MGGLFVLLVLLWIIAFGIPTAAIAHYKGRDPVLWFVIGGAFGIFGMIVAACMPDLLPRASQPVPATLPPSAPELGPADEIAKLAELRSKGVLTDEEFTAAKAKALCL